MSELPANPDALRTGWRRLLLFGPALATVTAGVVLMAQVLGTNAFSAAEAGILLVFAASFGWITLSFWAALIGLGLRMLRREPLTLKRAQVEGALPPLATRTAVVMPIYSEDTRRVFAGLAATYRSLAATGRLASFDFFVLSDTTNPDIWVAEEAFWRDACEDLDAAGRLFYRRRSENTGRKAGNIADWVRSWGGAYEGMVVLDADSVMAGETLVRLAAALEADPRAGIVQTLPLAANRETLFARALQFATRLYGPPLASGHAFWQAGESNYFGHNAIIRTRAFAVCCGLPKLPGAAPLGGEILSHDFVEAAFIRRGGWRVWMLPDLRGSWEEVPSNLIDYAVRDRRWAQGNLQHARLVGARGLHWVSRLHLVMGVLAFVASPLWLLLLLLSSGVVVAQAVTGHSYFLPGYSLFPVWPEYRPVQTYALLAMTLVILFLPKLLAIVLTLARREERRAFGGAGRLFAGALAELLFSVLLAPVMMLFHSTFVLTVLLGRTVGWGAQPRDDRGVDWADATRRHAAHSAIGAVWAGMILWFAPAFLPWVAPVVVGMLLAIPLNVLSSRVTAGRAARRLGLFLTPEEVAPPAELRLLAEELDRLAERKLPGFLDLLRDDRLGALHSSLLGSDLSEDDPDLLALAARAVADAEGLNAVERLRLLGSAAALHQAAQSATNARQIGDEVRAATAAFPDLLDTPVLQAVLNGPAGRNTCPPFPLATPPLSPLEMPEQSL
jgi:membrane glycosyltransferase